MVGETTCPHLIASWEMSSGEWWLVPAIGFDRLAEIAVADHDDAMVATAFGDLADLAETVEEERQGMGGTGLLEALIGEASVSQIEDVFWDDENGMGSDTGTDFFAADPAAALAALRRLVDRLAACQERLNVATAAERSP